MRRAPVAQRARQTLRATQEPQSPRRTAPQNSVCGTWAPSYGWLVVGWLARTTEYACALRQPSISAICAWYRLRIFTRDSYPPLIGLRHSDSTPDPQDDHRIVCA